MTAGTKMRITKRSPLRRMMREIEALWEEDGPVTMTHEELAEWLGTIAAYIERSAFRSDNLQKRIEGLEGGEKRLATLLGKLEKALGEDVEQIERRIAALEQRRGQGPTLNGCEAER